MMSPSVNSMWLDESDDLMLGEPSLMTTGICTMSVFDKFDWDTDFLGPETDFLLPDTDELLDKICIKTENEDDLLEEKSNTDFDSLSSIFPGLVDEATRSSSAKDIDNLKPISPPLSPDSLSLSSSLSSPTSLFSDSDSGISIIKGEPKYVKEESVESSTDDFDSFNSIESCPSPVHFTPVHAVAPAVKCAKEDVITVATTSPLITTTTSTATMKPAVIRIPVKRNPGTALHGHGGGRIKAVVVCPDRSKSIVCNVVRSTNKGIVIQKPINRTWLNVCSNIGNIRTESSKLPIKVNVISSKDSGLPSGSLRSFIAKTTTLAAATTINELPIVEAKSEPTSITTTSNFIAGTLATTTATATVPSLTSPTKIKIEWDEMRPETPQSMVGSDDEFYPFSSPSKISTKCFSDPFQDDFMKSCLMDEDNLCSESYKCVPPAEVTGQIQPVNLDGYRYTPDSSPRNSGSHHSDSLLDSFYTKTDTNGSGVPSQGQFYNKAAANVDHDYGFTCRTTKSANSIASIFNVDSLGIQTPSASEPPTDSDDDDTLLLNDVSLLNKDIDCTELDREQNEYFENLKHQLKLAELVCKNADKEHRTSKSSSGLSVKERKLAARNRKRKHSRERSSSSTSLCKSSADSSPTSTRLSSLPSIDISSIAGLNSIATNGSGSIKMRLPVKDMSPKKRKLHGNGGRIFSPSERHLHNTNEQVRRIEMRQSFEELRRLIPTLSDKPRAPKVSILQEAKMYCDDLLHTDLKLQGQVTAMRSQQEKLRCQLSRLRRNAAASRY